MAGCQSDYVLVCKTNERGLTPLPASNYYEKDNSR